MARRQAWANAREAEYQVEIRRDVRIPTMEGDVTLSADVYLPVGAGPVPAVVMVLPYRKDAIAGIFTQSMFLWFAERGYVCIIVDFRGVGSSDGERRPPMDTGEADDGVAAVEWAARQPWCDGNVGMWGTSRPGRISMLAASQGPPQLKAIIPSLANLDPGRYLLHPGGARGGITWFDWGLRQVINQLMPPLHNHHSADEQARWRQSMHETEPYMMDLFRHGPGDPWWRERAGDASGITVPALCLAGWRDANCEAQIRAFEEMQGPKKLVVGPWMHAQPHQSPHEPIDYFALALCWWDYWLRGIDNGLMDEPAVLLYVQGSNPGWRAYESWPPGKVDLALATDAGTTLARREPGEDLSSGTVGTYEPDPTAGSLSGLWYMSVSGFGMPLDQHEDDMRALSVTSAPLSNDVVISGHPEVNVWLGDKNSVSGTMQRFVVRLTDVDEDGSSKLITTGVVAAVRAAESHRVILCPTTYRVAAGRRLRVVLGDADFPRLWPTTNTSSVAIAGIELIAPTLERDAGAEVDVPGPADEQALTWGTGSRIWDINRDLIHDGVEIVVGENSTAPAPGGKHVVDMQHEVRCMVRRALPGAATILGTNTTKIKMGSGECVTVTANARLTDATLWVHADVSIDDMTIYSHIWDA